MNILVTNDDGIFSPALLALVEAACGFGDVTVAAPATGQSACGHGLSVHDVVEVEQVNINACVKAAYAIHGKPADCVKIAWRELMDDKPDIVLSGINIGANIGINALYSGTVAGAAEAVILGAPAVAFSIEICDEVEPNLQKATEWTRNVLENLFAGGQPDDRWFCNVNFPDGCHCEPVGVKVCVQSDCTGWEGYRRLDDNQGRQCYKLTSDYGFTNPAADSDAALIAQKYITVSPMGVDMTRRAKLDALSAVDWFKP